MSSARTEELERLRALRPDTLRIRLIAMSMPKIKDLANRLGATRITQNKLLMHDHGALRSSLIEWITHDDDDAEGEEGDDDDDTEPEVIREWLAKNADCWPLEREGEPPAEGAAADDARWSAPARGYEVRLCQDDPAKGRGVFATRGQRKGSVVGVYWGEILTRRQFVARHGWRHGVPVVPTAAERAEGAARRARLDALADDEGRPMGGSDNGGSYALLLLPDQPEGTRGFLGDLPSYVDAEDPGRSSWCRYINPAESAAEGCNAEVKVDGLRRLVWLELSRDVRRGEEVCFHYGDDNELSVAARKRAQPNKATSAMAAAREAAAGWGAGRSADGGAGSARGGGGGGRGGGGGGSGSGAAASPGGTAVSWPEEDMSWCGL